jgi:hypothetical protein|eukprot:SAG25_NODE_786_length_5332_cov_175.941525_3_plen_75_part_00
MCVTRSIDDRDRFVAAVTNVAAGRKWDQSQPGVVDQVPVPEPEPSERYIGRFWRNVDNNVIDVIMMPVTHSYTL